MGFPIRSFIALGCMAVAIPADARSAREAWDAQIASTCPAAHVEWTPFSSYGDLQGAYLDSLPKRLSQKIVASAQNRSARPCSQRNASMQCYEYQIFEAIARSGQLAS